MLLTLIVGSWESDPSHLSVHHGVAVNDFAALAIVRCHHDTTSFAQHDEHMLVKSKCQSVAAAIPGLGKE